MTGSCFVRSAQSVGARRRLARAALAAACGILATTSAFSLTLTEAYQAALASDPVFAGARAAYLAELERLPQARANLLPWVSASADATYSDTRTRFTNELQRRHNYADNYGYQLVLTQPLFDWTSWKNYEAAKLGVTLSELRLQQAFQALLLRVSQAYFNVLATEDSLIALEAERSAIAEQLASARRNFELGTATITDSYEAQARYDLVQARLLQAENTLQVQRNALEQIIGQAPGELARLPPGTPAPAPDPARIDAWIDRAQTDNLQVVQAQVATTLAGNDIEIARAGRYPTVDLVASFGQTNNRYVPPVTASANAAGDGRSRGTSSAIGIQLSIPIYTGGLHSSRISQAVALEQQARHGYENARREATQAVRESFLGVNSGLAQIRALEAGEESSRKALEANQTGYEVGVRINLDVLNAQQQLFATRRDLAQARYDTLMAGLRLKAAAGLLTEADLDGINRLLRPRSNDAQRP